MPHNLETLCLCYTNQTSSEVPISSSNRDTVQKGGETAFSFPQSSLPRCRVVITQREVPLRLGIPPSANAARHATGEASGIPSSLWRLRGKTSIGRSVRRWDAERKLELADAEFRTTADADQVPESV